MPLIATAVELLRETPDAAPCEASRWIAYAEAAAACSLLVVTALMLAAA